MTATAAVRQLANALQPTPGAAPSAGLHLRQGVVTATSTAPNAVTVRVGKATTPTPGVRYLSGYAPTAGDVVFLLQNGPDLLVLGTLA